MDHGLQLYFLFHNYNDSFSICVSLQRTVELMKRRGPKRIVEIKVEIFNERVVVSSVESP